MKTFLPYLIAIAAAFGLVWGGYELGSHMRGLEADLATTQDLATARKDLLDANKRVRDAQNLLDEANEELDHLREKEKDRVNTAHNRFIADVHSGAIRVSIPVKAGSCTDGATTAQAAAPAGQPEETRAELAAAAAEDLAAIARDGDLAIVDLNDLIDRYNAAREKLKQLDNTQLSADN